MAKLIKKTHKKPISTKLMFWGIDWKLIVDYRKEKNRGR
jgi:hypothetical protein